MNHQTKTLGQALAGLLLAAAPTLGVDTGLLACLPPKHLAFIAIEPSAQQPEDTPQDASFMRFAGRMIQQVSQLAGLDRNRSAGIVADVVATLGMLADYPYLVVITDARAETTGPGHFKLAELQAALLVRAPQAQDVIARQIQVLLTAHTQRDRARIEQRVEAGYTIYTLVDDRAPAWARISWAQLGEFYAVALGDSAFQACLAGVQQRQASGGQISTWLGTSFQATVAGQASLLWAFHPEPVRTALGPDIRPALNRVLASLGIEDADHAVWSVRRENRAVLATVAYDVHGQVQRVEMTRKAITASEKQAIPGEATSYAIIQFPVAEAIDRAVQAYLTSRRPEPREALRTAWDTAARDAGLDLSSELYDQLGDRIIIHDYPPHPLRIPLLVTILAEIRGSSASVERALDTVLIQADRWLGGSAERDFLSPRIVHQADGIWTLRVGFDGPSLGVSDRWIVVGHSPAAVREVRKTLGYSPSPAPLPPRLDAAPAAPKKADQPAVNTPVDQNSSGSEP